MNFLSAYHTQSTVLGTRKLRASNNKLTSYRFHKVEIEKEKKIQEEVK